MAKTATDITHEHYNRPEVRSAILRYCQGAGMFRALNGGDSWYKVGSDRGSVMLTIPEDYDDLLINKHRTLYATIDLLNDSVKNVSEKWDLTKSAPENPIGTLKDCRGFTLSVDIDSIKGHSGENIVTSPEIKKAVEDATQFFMDYLRDRGGI